MFRALVVVSFLLATAAIAWPQPPVVQPHAAPSPAVPDLQWRRPITNPPLARDEAERLRQRLEESLARQASAAPRDTALRAAGLPRENDAVERAAAARRTRTVGPLAVGLTEAGTHAKDAVDPALAAAARLGLRARLEREPSAAEIAEEVKAFDARVEKANRWLAANRGRIAKAYAATGAMPPAFDAEALDAAPAAGGTDSTDARAGFRALFRRLLTEPDQAGPDPPAVVPRGPRLDAPAVPRAPASPAPDR
jgi:hypothetical protein